MFNKKNANAALKDKGIEDDVIYHMEIQRPIFSPFTKITVGKNTVCIDAYAAAELIKIWKLTGFDEPANFQKKFKED